MNSVITLTTDFGMSDPYVGIMKGVILDVNPAASIIDLTHNIEPQNILQAAWAVKTAFQYFPAGALHVIVVDPGVGTGRRIVALETEKYIFLAPDNGVLTLVLDEVEVVRACQVDNKDYFLKKVSSTFHGRDIFAPAGAHISTGIDIGKMGRKIDADGLVTLDVKRPCLAAGGRLTGSVMDVDRFGNLTTDISRALLEKSFPDILPEKFRIRIKENEIKGLSESYQSVERGRLLSIIGSSDTLEVALGLGSAASFCQAAAGDTVTVAVPRDEAHESLNSPVEDGETGFKSKG